MTQSLPHPLVRRLAEAAGGRFPPSDGSVEIVGPPPGRADAVVAFTGHSLIATSIAPEDVRAQLLPDDLGASMDARFLAWLAARLGVDPGSADAVLVAAAGAGQPRHRLERRTDLDAHPRIVRARAHRTDVRAWSDAEGQAVVSIGRGLAERWEISLEIDEGGRDRGLGRAVIVAGLHELPPGEPVFAQVAPGNARSLRAFLAAGFAPIGGEVLFVVR